MRYTKKLRLLLKRRIANELLYAAVWTLSGFSVHEAESYDLTE